jgi:uncharacterized membrane protein (UPF0136 family)
VNRSLSGGAIAGLAGTVAFLAMRAFDERYAPLTVAMPRDSSTPGPLQDLSHGNRSLTLRIGGGVLAGIAYGLIGERRRSKSSLVNGVMLGASVYAASDLVGRALTGIGPLAWRQSFPQVAGELLRRITYGVTTAAIYEAIHEPPDSCPTI